METNETQESGGGSPAQERQDKLMQNRRELAYRIMMVNSVQPSGVFSFHTQYDMIKQFHVGALGKGNCYVGNLATPTPLEILQARYGLIKEEFGEDGGIEYLGQIARGEIAPSSENLAVLLDWIVDMNYFFMGLAVNLGLPYDTAFLHIHHANMQKVMVPGGPVFREDGKVVKPEGWKDPAPMVLEAVLLQASEDQKKRSSGEATNQG